jgi:hypothetical protein
MSSPNANSPKPRWWQLYATFPLALVLLVLEHWLPLSPGGHQAVQIGIVLLVFGLVYVWLRANTLALIEEDRRQNQWKATVTEFHSSWPPATPAEGGNGHWPMFHLPEAGLRNTLDDTFELDSVNRIPTDSSLN